MAEASKGKGWVLKGLGCMAVLAVLCCCGGLVSLRFFPDMFLSYLLADTPLTGPTTEAKPVLGALERTAACLSMATTGEARMAPEAVARLLVGEGDPDLAVLRITAAGDEANLELSVGTDDEPPRYFNLQLNAAIAMNEGWFTDLRASRLVVRDHDWSSYLSGTQLSAQANQNLANKRAENDEFAQLLDGVGTLWVEEGLFVISLKPESLAMQKLCNPS